jgi:hypothetical protein
MPASVVIDPASVNAATELSGSSLEQAITVATVTRNVD